MTFTEAIGVLLSASEVRRDQWQGVAEGEPVNDLTNELDVDALTGTEAEDMARLITEAMRVVRKIY